MGFYGPMGPAGFRRRGRRRGLVLGAAAGASIMARRQQRLEQSPGTDSPPSRKRKQAEE